MGLKYFYEMTKKCARINRILCIGMNWEATANLTLYIADNSAYKIILWMCLYLKNKIYFNFTYYRIHEIVNVWNIKDLKIVFLLFYSLFTLHLFSWFYIILHSLQFF